MAVQDQPDVPRLTQSGFEIGPMELPLPALQSPSWSGPATREPWIMKTFALSAATANVRTFYRGDQGHFGKLDYVRD